MRPILLAALLGLLLPLGAAAHVIPVRIEQGILHGTTEDGIPVFKNVPFAAAPVGQLRWRAPQPAPGWSTPRDASTFGPACPQNQRISMFTPRLKQSEDCLTLNIWTPAATAGRGAPVMVWIHGGGFIEGSAALPIYDGTDLAKHGVVVVTINYRLGELGFLAHPALSSATIDGVGGNFGLLDQIAALKWVQGNIAAFGGDPQNVTIFGESAGGVSVNDLLVSPLARGLFEKAISESGLGLQETPTREDAEEAGVAFAARLAVTGTDAGALARLRALSVKDILKNQGSMSEGKIGPFIDGDVIPSDPSLLFARGEIAHVRYLAGSNSNEASLAPSLGIDPVQGLSRFGDQLAQVRAIYESGGPLTDAEFGRQVFGDALFTSAAQALAGFVAKTGESAYVYHFAYVANHYRGKVPGVSHGGEIAYIFGLRGLGFLRHFASNRDEAVIKMMQNYWTNFAKTGDPNGPGLPVWNGYSPAEEQTLVIDDDTRSVADFRRAEVAIMKRAWSHRVGYAGP